MEERKAIDLSKGFLPIGVAVITVLSITGAILWFAGTAAVGAQNAKDIVTLSSRVNGIDLAQQALSSKQAVFEVKIDTVLERIQEIKATLEKQK